MPKIRKTAELMTKLRQDYIKSPSVIKNAPGINILGNKIKSIMYSTDVAVISNSDADAILAVYPWTPNTRILDAITRVANVPILAGIGGGLTKGARSAALGRFAEEHGAQGVVLNSPTTIETIEQVRQVVDIPIFYTLTSEKKDIEKYINAGINGLNIAGGKRTASLISWALKEISQYDENFPIIASGGESDADISATILAGAHAITFTSYGKAEKLFQSKMEKYRKNSLF